jgi:hypothetical protein
MGFADRYLHSVNSTDHRDDEHHHATVRGGAGIGALMSRVTYARYAAQAV